MVLVQSIQNDGPSSIIPIAINIPTNPIIRIMIVSGRSIKLKKSNLLFFFITTATATGIGTTGLHCSLVIMTSKFRFWKFKLLRET